MADNEDGSLLVVVLDTNPFQQPFLGDNPAKLNHWANTAVAFLNLHLGLNQTNEAALLCSGKFLGVFPSEK